MEQAVTRNDVLLAGLVFLAGSFTVTLAAYVGVNRLVYGRWLG